MHPITVRTMKFDIPDMKDFDPLCIAGSSVLSYTHLAMGLLFAYVEPFVVKSLRRVMERIRDEALREEVDRFARQEAQHFQRHRELNKFVFELGYPGLEQRCEKLERDYEGFLAHRSERFCIGYIEGFESYTTQIALSLLTGGLYDHRRTNRAIGELFKWHMMEEIEHRNVAFDVYEHLYGGYLNRARLCFIAQNHMFRFSADCMKIMSAVDVARYGERSRISLRQKTMMALDRAGKRIRTMLPGYTPHQYTVPAELAALSAHFTKLARNIR